MPVRRRVASLRENYGRLAAKARLKTIRVDACLLGGDNGLTSAKFARLAGAALPGLSLSGRT
jgi:hypothetical protein